MADILAACAKHEKTEPAMTGRASAARSAQRHADMRPARLSAVYASCAADGAGRILFRVFEVLDRTGIRYCVLHGYETYPRQIGSDVDLIIDRDVTPAQLYALLRRHRAEIGAEVVRCQGYFMVLAGKDDEGHVHFVALDFSVDSSVSGVPFYQNAELLGDRRRHGAFWIPGTNVEFGSYLARTIAKGALDDRRVLVLTRLHRQDPDGCVREVERFWSGRNAGLVRAAIDTGDWRPLRENLGSIRMELKRRAIERHPARFASARLLYAADRLKRLWRPDGFSVVLLGPDGAGKSSVVGTLAPALSCAFARSACYGFAPSLRQLLGGNRRSTSAPHGLPTRSFFLSLVRGIYWLGYYLFSYFHLRFVLARSTLVLYDRHFIDILVDSRRYRYGGPAWLLRLIMRVAPEPDLVVILIGPPEVLQARKRELSVEETSRQLRVYLAMVRAMKNGHIVEATQSPQRVTSDIRDAILRKQADRIAHRFGIRDELPEQASEATRA